MALWLLFRCTHQSCHTSATAILSDHPHGLIDRQSFDHMVNILSLILAQNLECVDLLRNSLYESAVRGLRVSLSSISMILTATMAADFMSLLHCLSILMLLIYVGEVDSPHINTAETALPNELD